MVRSLRLLLVFAALGLPALAVAETFDRAIAAAAARWLEAAGPAGEGASFAFSDRERRDWHFTPRGREGLMIGDMSRAQREATTALMRTTLSSPGVLKAQDIMRLEAVLAEVEGSSLRYRNPEGYYVSVFGDPNGYPWGWRLEGHHLSINVTIAAPNEAFVTPLFTGTNPAVPPSDSGFAKVIQQDEMTLAFRLIRSLDPEQAAAARLSSSPRNIVTGPGSGDALDRWAGIMGGGLTDGQRRGRAKVPAPVRPGPSGDLLRLGRGGLRARGLLLPDSRPAHSDRVRQHAGRQPHPRDLARPPQRLRAGRAPATLRRQPPQARRLALKRVAPDRDYTTIPIGAILRVSPPATAEPL